MVDNGLAGLRVVIVEDVSLVAMLLEDILVDWGCTVASVVSEIEAADEKLRSIAFDLVILDVDLNGTRTLGIAEWLAQRRIPFVFSTGYPAAGIPQGFRNIPVVNKPFERDELARALRAAVSAVQAGRPA